MVKWLRKLLFFETCALSTLSSFPALGGHFCFVFSPFSDSIRAIIASDMMLGIDGPGMISPCILHAASQATVIIPSLFIPLTDSHLFVCGNRKWNRCSAETPNLDICHIFPRLALSLQSLARLSINIERLPVHSFICLPHERGFAIVQRTTAGTGLTADRSLCCLRLMGSRLQ